jgi:DNA-binding transcriptional ArsR family regulator
VVEHYGAPVAATLDATYDALGHEARRAVLTRLRDGPARVTDLAASFDMSLAGVSKHIVRLERAGLVERQVRGRDHWISLRAEPLADAAAWLGLYRAFWGARLDALDELLRGDGNA